MTQVTCRPTAKNRDQLRNPTLGNRVWATFSVFVKYSSGTLLLVVEYVTFTFLFTVSQRSVISNSSNGAMIQHALDMTQPAAAARALAAVDRYLLPAPRLRQAADVDRRDRRTDGRPLHRLCTAYSADSVDKLRN